MVLWYIAKNNCFYNVFSAILPSCALPHPCFNNKYVYRFKPPLQRDDIIVDPYSSVEITFVRKYKRAIVHEVTHLHTNQGVTIMIDKVRALKPCRQPPLCVVNKIAAK